MKRIGYSLILTVAAILLASGVATAQEDAAKKAADEKQKQKELEALKKKQEASVDELKKIQEKKAQEKKVITEEEIAKKMEEIEAKAKEQEEKDFDLQEYFKDLPDGQRRAIIRVPDERTFNVTIPDFDNRYLYLSDYYTDKPGSSWNYSRQVVEATFINEFTMNAGEAFNDVSLAVSGDCAEGSISVAIIMPDGKQLSEILIDENGSLNWRKNFENAESDTWKNGKWIFRINAKNATGNFRISMSAH